MCARSNQIGYGGFFEICRNPPFRRPEERNAVIAGRRGRKGEIPAQRLDARFLASNGGLRRVTAGCPPFLTHWCQKRNGALRRFGTLFDRAAHMCARPGAHACESRYVRHESAVRTVGLIEIVRFGTLK